MIDFPANRNGLQAPANLPSLPTDPEGLAEALAMEPSLFAYWQAMAEQHRYDLDRLKNSRDFLRSTAYLSATGTADQRKAASAADPDAQQLVTEIEETEHRYRQALNEMTASDVRMTATKKLLSWRIEESRNLAMGEQPTSRRRANGNNINFTDR